MPYFAKQAPTNARPDVGNRNEPSPSPTNQSQMARQLQRAVANPRSASPDTIRELSHRYGNCAVQRLLTQSRQPTPATPAAPVATRTIQRKDYAKLGTKIQNQQNQPDDGSTKFFDLSIAVTAKAPVRSKGNINENGHGWIELEMKQPWSQAITDPDFQEIKDEMTPTTKVNLLTTGHTSIGFYPGPDSSTLGFLLATQGEISEPEGPSMLASTAAKKSFPLNKKRSLDLLKFLAKKRSNVPIYSFIGYNCTDFAVEAVRKAGYSASDYLGKVSYKKLTSPNKVYKRIYERAALGDQTARVHTRLRNNEQSLIEPKDQAKLEANSDATTVDNNIQQNNLNRSPQFTKMSKDLSAANMAHQTLVDMSAAGKFDLTEYQLLTQEEQTLLKRMYPNTLNDHEIKPLLWRIHGLMVGGIQFSWNKILEVRQNMRILLQHPWFDQILTAPNLPDFARALNLTDDQLKAELTRLKRIHTKGFTLPQSKVKFTAKTIKNLRRKLDFSRGITVADVNNLGQPDDIKELASLLGKTEGEVFNAIMEAFSLVNSGVRLSTGDRFSFANIQALRKRLDFTPFQDRLDKANEFTPQDIKNLVEATGKTQVRIKKALKPFIKAPEKKAPPKATTNVSGFKIKGAVDREIDLLGHNWSPLVTIKGGTPVNVTDNEFKFGQDDWNYQYVQISVVVEGKSYDGFVMGSEIAKMEEQNQPSEKQPQPMEEQDQLGEKEESDTED